MRSKALLLGPTDVFENTAEPAYGYIVFNRFLAIVELLLTTFFYIPLLFYPSAYEKGLPGLPGKSLGVGLKMVSDSKPVGEK